MLNRCEQLRIKARHTGQPLCVDAIGLPIVLVDHPQLPWIRHEYLVSAVLSSRSTHGECAPTSNATRADAHEPNLRRNAIGVVANRLSSIIAPDSSSTHTWLSRSPTSTPIVSLPATLVCFFIANLPWASSPIQT